MKVIFLKYPLLIFIVILVFHPVKEIKRMKIMELTKQIVLN